jgi:hypothetical protein
MPGVRTDFAQRGAAGVGTAVPVQDPYTTLVAMRPGLIRYVG